MSDREDDLGRPSDETVASSDPPAPPPPPPPATQPLPVDPPPTPPPSRRILIGALLFLLVFGGGFAAAKLFGGKTDGRIPDKNVVFFEPVAMAFPVEGAKFTNSTYDADHKTCDKELLKRYLRGDERRFKAWLELVEIRREEFDAFVDQLDTRILTAPLPVTNHGCFKEGEGRCPFAIQSVLAIGTPVWYNPTTHEVIAKCLCSNPVLPPACPPNCGGGETPAPTPSQCPCITESPGPDDTRPPKTDPPTKSPPPTETPPETDEPPETDDPPETKPPQTETPTDRP